MTYNPGLGHPWSLEPPASILGADGFVDPGAMRDLVYRALWGSVGGVLPIGAGSYPLVTWIDGSLHVSAGEWATGFTPTPRDVLSCLFEEGAGEEGFAERRLVVRYWTVRPRTPPGPFEVQVAVYAREPDRAIVVPAHVRCLVADFLEDLS